MVLLDDIWRAQEAPRFQQKVDFQGDLFTVTNTLRLADSKAPRLLYPRPPPPPPLPPAPPPSPSPPGALKLLGEECSLATQCISNFCETNFQYKDAPAMICSAESHATWTCYWDNNSHDDVRNVCIIQEAGKKPKGDKWHRAGGYAADCRAYCAGFPCFCGEWEDV